MVISMLRISNPGKAMCKYLVYSLECSTKRKCICSDVASLIKFSAALCCKL